MLYKKQETLKKGFKTKYQNKKVVCG